MAFLSFQIETKAFNVNLHHLLNVSLAYDKTLKGLKFTKQSNVQLRGCN